MGIIHESGQRRLSAVKRLFTIFCAMVLVSTLFPLQPAGAVDQNCDKEFYSANDIVTYDPCAEICSTTAGSGDVTIEDSKETAESVFKFLISTPLSTNGDKALNAVQAAGILGNMQAESGVDSKTIQSNAKYDESRAMNKGVGGYAFGLVQWDGGRRVQLLEYAKSRSTSWDDLETQLNFLKKELEGGESAIIRDSVFRSTADPGEAAVRFRAVFERAGIPHDENRIKYANAFYDKFKDLVPGGVTFGSGGRCSASGGGNGDIVKTAELLAWPDRKPNGFFDDKPEYTRALEEVGLSTFPAPVGTGDSCDAFVAAVMRYSGLDKDYHCCYANTQAEYMRKHTEKYQEVGHVSDTSNLQPGDILWRDGHIKIYLGDGRQADASYNQRTASIAEETYFDGTYYAFRFIGGGTAASPTPSPSPQVSPQR